MTKVKLRNKLISRGRRSLFLDIYPPIVDPNTHKKVRWDYLDLYLWDKCKTQDQKDYNKQTEALAETLRARRQIDIQNKNYGFRCTDELDKDFLEYFKGLSEKRLEGNKGGWDCALYYLKLFSNGEIRFRDLTTKYCNEFREFILKAPRIRSPRRTIVQNSAQGYFNKFKAALRQAYKDGILKQDISLQLERIKDGDTQRNFLNIEEVNALIKTECGIPILKKAAIFSVMTGMRFSDIKKLVWGEIQKGEDEEGNDVYSIHFTQKKTKGSQVLPLSQQAYEWIGKRGEDNDKIFDGLYYSAFINFHLKRWILDAGITKNITFHCCRHSAATLLLTNGVDIFTISKILGHRDIKTTMIYVKSLDADKRKAVNKIKLNFSTSLP